MHKLNNLNIESRTAVCSLCGPTKIRNKGLSKYNTQKWRCSTTHKEKTKVRPHRKTMQDFCQKCGFIPENMCQLDVDHIDGNHKNNKKDNLQTLCANCHRLKTFNNKDWQKST